MPKTILIDMRCLQDARYIERGIQAHARSAVLLARQSSRFANEARIIGIVDPKLDELPADVTAVLDECRPNAYLPGLPPGSIFYNPSPMEPDQSFLGRLLMNPFLAKAAAVHDFIPFENQDEYLATAEKRLDYMSSMVWLNRYDAFLPNSASTQMRLQALLPVGARMSVVTGVPVAPWLECTTPGTPRHVLVVAGGDPRKNPELAIRAHAASGAMQQQRIPLIVNGVFGPDRAKSFYDLAVRSGGDPGLLALPGRVSAEVLQAQYRDAICVVTPSRAEGFSMPVVEAMAMGVPSLASDIAVHAALVPDPALRFGTDDDAALTALLDRIATDNTFRINIIAAQQPVWKPFHAATVAAKLWAALETLAAQQPARPMVGGRRPRVAMLTPLPPTKSGTADYSAELIVHLGRRVELSVFSESRHSGAAPMTSFPLLSAGIDRVIGVMGNSHHHRHIYELQNRNGGACICHDGRLMGMYTARHGLSQAARFATRETGRRVTAEEISLWHEDETRREASFLGELATAARPLIFHAAASVEMVAKQFGRQAEHLPFAVYRPWNMQPSGALARREARARLGIGMAERVIASFGFISRIKGIEPALHAIATLRDIGLPCRLICVGQWDEDDKMLRALAHELNVQALVTLGTGYIDETTYRDYLLAADYGLQLRMGLPGAISGALQDCIAAGLPSVANRDLAENLNAPSYVRVIQDGFDATMICEALTELIETPRTAQMIEEERQDYCHRHSMARYSERLCALLDL